VPAHTTPAQLPSAAQRSSHTSRPATAPGRRRTRVLAALVGTTVLVASLAACSKAKPAQSTWPDGAQVVADSATAVTGITSTHLTIDLSPALGSNPPIKRVDIDLTAAGDAKGEVEIQALGSAVTTLQLVVLGAAAAPPTGASYVYYTALGWINYPQLAQTYDTEAILDANRGLPKLLATATDAKTVDSETVGDVDTWKVSVTFNNATVGTLIHTDLGTAPLTGNVWIAKDTHLPAKAEVHVPASPGNYPEAVVTFELTKFNESVTIKAPVLG
jgi:hypothetical protein